MSRDPSATVRSLWMSLGRPASALSRRARAGRRRPVRREWWLESLEGRVVPATIPVTSLADTGPGTLRAAIEQADLDTTPDTITFDPAVVGTITLASALPNLSTEIDIEGPGASALTVARSGADGTPNFRIFTVPFAADVSITGLTISGGYATGDVGGGGVDNDGTLSITNSTISGNSADDGGGIDNDGALTVTNTTVSSNSAAYGGGIYNDYGINDLLRSMLTVTNITLSGNTAAYGGGIYNSSTLTVTNTTLSGNSADDDGGGMYNDSGTLTVTNTTLSGNSVGNDGGGIANTGTLTVTDSTLSGNSAGLSSGGIYGAVMLTGSILDNAGVNVAGPLTSGGHNLFSDDPSESDSSAPVLTPTDLVDTEPLLGPLSDNGGPTQTMALLPGSPAIDTGVTIAGVATDQRGIARPQGSAPDIGAFELDRADHPFVQLISASGPKLVGTAQTFTATVFDTDLQPLSGVAVTFRVTTGPNAGATGSTDPLDGRTDSGGHIRFAYTGTGGVGSDIVVATATLPGGATVDSPPASAGWGSLTVTTPDDAGPGSLRMAIALANELAGPDSITFDPSVTGTITLTTAIPDLSADIDIEGPGASALTVARSAAAGTPDFRIFTVSAGAQVTVSGLTVSGGRMESIYDIGGGGVWNSGTLTFTNSTISGNFSGDGDGGGIYNGGTLTLTNSTISGNLSGVGQGSGIANYGTVTATNCTIRGNTGIYAGGGMDIFNNGTVTATNCAIGGSVYGIENGGAVTATNCTISGNSGHGIYNGGTLTVTDCTISGNSTNSDIIGDSGEGIFNLGGTVTVTDCTISDNQGGGIINNSSVEPLGDPGTILPPPVILPGRVSASTSIFANTGGVNISDDGYSTFTSLGHNLFTDSPTVSLGPTDLIDTDPLLGPLADNGGPTLTQALLPGSPAIDAGVAVPGVTTDQRGVARTQGVAPDIGAFESRGFTLTVAAGDDQAAPTFSAFLSPLVVVVASPFGEPVAGGRVTFDAPTTGASAVLAPDPATIGPDGRAGVDAVANGRGGTYTVTARAAGASPVAFALTNAPPNVVIPPTNVVIPPTVVGLQATGHQAPRTAIVLTFSQPMDAARAQDKANYRLVWAESDHRLGSRDDRVIGIRGARYDPASEAVSLRLVHGQPLHRTLWLTFAGPESGGLTDADGTALAGLGTGEAGGGNALRLDLESLQTPMWLGLLPGGGFEAPRALGRKKALTLSAGGRPLGSWQITAGSVNVQRYWPVAERRQSLDLNGISPGTIEQSFATVPGQVYQLLFDYGNNPDARGRTATATVTVTGASTRLSEGIAHAGSRPRDMKYTRFFGAFRADSTVTTLRFASTTPGAYGIVLDAVLVTAVPGAASGAPLMPLRISPPQAAWSASKAMAAIPTNRRVEAPSAEPL